MNFLRNGDDYYQVIFKQDAITTFEDLDKAYSNHMRIHQKEDKARIGGDHYPIKAAGYTVVCQNLCKICKQKASVDTCNKGPNPHYDPKNRFKKLVIENMRLDAKVSVQTYLPLPNEKT
jgi:hypothetical protein